MGTVDERGPMRGALAASARRVATVASMSVREALRRRVLLAAALMSLAFLLLYGLGLYFASKDILAAAGRGMNAVLARAGAAQMLYVGLLPTSFMVSVTAVFASVGAISAEVDTGVISAVVARPIRRSELVLGKFLGLASMLVVYSALLNGAVILLAVHFVRAPLTDWPLGLAMLAAEPLFLLSLAMLGTARLPTLANGVLCAAAYGIGLVGGFIEQIGGLLSNHTMMNLGVVSSLLVPLDAIHRKALTYLLPPGLLITGGGPPGVTVGESTTPSMWMVAYAAGYVILMVWLAARAFRRRDL
jgi:Cu-processing system permease protein